MLTRQRQEMRVVAGLQHPHLVAVYDARMADASNPADEGPAYLVLEFVDGPSLAKRISDDGAMSPADVVGIGIAVASALDVVHASGLVHRDIKPGNISSPAPGTRSCPTSASPGRCAQSGSPAPQMYSAPPPT